MYKIAATAVIALILVYTVVLNQNLFKSKSINILLIGDVGTADINQHFVAKQLNKIGEEKQSKMVLSLGDNFYSNGVESLDDPLWDKAYANIYPKMSYLKDLTWYGVIGNHDFRGLGLFTEFEYKKNNWRIDDFFWTHTDIVEGNRIAFIHIDTNFLAEGIEGSSAQDHQMGKYFKQLGWTNDQQMLDMVEEQLILYQDYEYIMAMGHHHIGYSCPEQLNTGKLYDLFQKYNVDVYINGHSHTLAFTIQDNMGMVVSGAGANFRYNECEEANPMWSKGYIYGFMDMEVYENQIIVTAHYIDYLYLIHPNEKWQSLQLPPIKRRQKQQLSINQ